MRTELISATFESNQPKLMYSLSGSNDKEQESINLQEFPWAIQRDIPYRIEAEKDDQGNVVLSNPRLEFLARWQKGEGKTGVTPGVARFNAVVKQIPSDAL